MKWTPQAVVAVIMGLTVLTFSVMNSPLWVRLMSYDAGPPIDPSASKAWASIMTGIVGALSVYIATGMGKDDK